MELGDGTQDEVGAVGLGELAAVGPGEEAEGGVEEGEVEEFAEGFDAVVGAEATDDGGAGALCYGAADGGGGGLGGGETGGTVVDLDLGLTGLCCTDVQLIKLLNQRFNSVFNRLGGAILGAPSRRPSGGAAEAAAAGGKSGNSGNRQKKHDNLHHGG